jgi:hypothetical protein
LRRPAPKPRSASAATASKSINFDQGLVTVKFEKKKIHFGLANVVQMDELDEEAALTEAPKAKKAK